MYLAQGLYGLLVASLYSAEHIGLAAQFSLFEFIIVLATVLSILRDGAVVSFHNHAEVFCSIGFSLCLLLVLTTEYAVIDKIVYGSSLSVFIMMFWFTSETLKKKAYANHLRLVVVGLALASSVVALFVPLEFKVDSRPMVDLNVTGCIAIQNYVVVEDSNVNDTYVTGTGARAPRVFGSCLYHEHSSSLVVVGLCVLLFCVSLFFMCNYKPPACSQEDVVSNDDSVTGVNVPDGGRGHDPSDMTVNVIDDE